jgi:hypothetical protein
MEGWDRNVNWSRDALERIVVLLFALANLADLAAGAPFLRRRQVLGILGCGEVEARAFIIGMVSGASAPEDAPEWSGDAACLAVRFRALAMALCVLLPRIRQSAYPGWAGQRACRLSHRMSAPAVRRLDAPALPAPDTS